MKVNGTNLEMVRGDSESIAVTFSNYDPQPGDKVEMTVRRNVRSNAVIRKSVNHFSGRTAIISLAPEDTERLDPGKYVYDVQLTYGGAVKTIIPPSTFNIGEDVTYG